MKTFIAFDFDTANSNRHSICSVGLVFVENGKIKETIYQLINPEEEIDPKNISVHQITPEDVKDAPTFAKFYNSIRNKIANNLLVTHNLLNKGYALRDNLERYQIDACSNHLLCTYQLSKRMISNPPSLTLKSLCRHFGINFSSNRNNALVNAEACAKLMLNLVENYGLADFDTLYQKTCIIPGEISKNHFRTSFVKNSKFGRIRANAKTIIDAKISDSERNLFGKTVVFTKKLNNFTRSGAAKIVIKLGGKFSNSISNETDYLVVGNLDEVMKSGKKSSKLAKAEKMLLEGKNIEILSEADFLKMAKNQLNI